MFLAREKNGTLYVHNKRVEWNERMQFWDNEEEPEENEIPDEGYAVKEDEWMSFPDIKSDDPEPTECIIITWDEYNELKRKAATLDGTLKNSKYW